MKIGVYASNDAFGMSSVSGIQKAVQALAPPSTTVALVTYDTSNNASTYDFASDMATVMGTTNPTTKMADGAPDMVFMAVLGAPATAMVQAYAAGKYTVPLQSSSAFRRNYILTQIGDAANGVEGDSPQIYASTPSGQAFASAFQAASGTPPEMPAAGAYDAAVALMLGGIEAAVSLPDPSTVAPSAIRDGVAKSSTRRAPPSSQLLTASPRHISSPRRASRSITQARRGTSPGTPRRTTIPRWCIGRFKISNSSSSNRTSATRPIPTARRRNRATRENGRGEAKQGSHRRRQRGLLRLRSDRARLPGLPGRGDDQPLRLREGAGTELPDIVLVDVTMPSLSGPKLIELARKKKTHDCPIVLYSDRGEEELRQLAASCGASGFIRKTSDELHLYHADPAVPRRVARPRVSESR